MISLFHPKSTKFSELYPDTIVFTYQLHLSPATEPWVLTDNWILCDCAYLSPREAKEHFWYTTHKEPQLKKVSMSLSEYIQRSVKAPSMNPFAALNRIEWLRLWNKRLNELDQ